jgi:hypothetical protein
VRGWSTDHRATSAYVLDKKDNRFWICTVRYNFNSEKDNSGDCQPLPVVVGRPSLTPDHESQPVLGSSLISDNLPLFWFIKPHDRRRAVLRAASSWAVRADEDAAVTALLSLA